MDGIANSHIRKWLGLPCCLSETGLFGRNILQLPLQSISLGYKQGKTRLVQELRESTQRVGEVCGCPGAHKWKAQFEVDQAISRLQHLEVVGRVQAGRTGLGWGEALQFWSKVNMKEMVVSDVTKMEEEQYKIKQCHKVVREAGLHGRALSAGRSVGRTCGKFLKPDSVSSSDQPMTLFLVPATFTSGLAMRSAAHSAMLPMQASNTSCQDARPRCPKGAIDGDTTRS
ncbi:hypothetical protein AAFF_G00051260 [Aldrovandia affinis]|uniref:Uncharacterized protein n=1 Tax=Aldrovandia affinis TaxID=143900 RepID=A0AAD7T4I9_9TELE|nr:hypothetical protein AAFF_G00051260 [Aldrovandia affinis]